MERYRHCEESINEEPYEARIHPQKGIAAGEDEEDHNAYADNKTCEYSCFGHAFPEEAANDTRKELAHTVISEDEEVHQFIGKEDGENERKSCDNEHHDPR